MKPEEFDPYFARTVRRPLLGWTLADVWAIHDKYSVPRNPLYDPPYDAERVGCWPCFMLRKKEVRRLAEVDPQRIEFLRAQQDRMAAHKADGVTRPFFYVGRVPPSQRTGIGKRKDGRELKYSTLDDVVRWSKTVRGGKQYALGTIEEDAFEADDDKTISCPSAIGQCE